MGVPCDAKPGIAVRLARVGAAGQSASAPARIRPGGAMKGHSLAAFAIILAACSGGAPSKSDREAATAALQNEAAALKRDGEKMPPSLGVTATWTVTGVEVLD